MKKIIIVTVFLALAATAPVFAHCGKCGMGEGKGMMDDSAMVDKKVEKMASHLGLSEDQAKQVKALLKEKMDKKKAVMEKKKTDMQAIMDEYQAKLKTILTPEQYEKHKMMKEMKEEMKQEMMEMKGSRHMEKGSMHEHKGSY